MNRFGIRGSTSVVTATEAARLAAVPGVTTASSILIVEDRHSPPGGEAGSANLAARSPAVLIVVDRHTPTSDTLRLQTMTG
ncbi:MULTISPECIES: hypothetical protein [Methanoculleus]|jgi:hypothetical protein|uniref:Uncharacterized protein n=1 Tax=Methanoculleus thermophilus TaxID=2200 RepID=A0A1G8XIF3_9EURY|nr:MULTISPECIES: hypothetical protein [Methanoculleus]NLN08428.1 hypothetical protein [Methanoculleus thermophilus]SDJ90014.1 hypothetical protein SAMN04488571_101442 [Methanoculleus thermophilus]HQD25307.1 hypothetical protein [Methanoculleus thermophilus]